MISVIVPIYNTAVYLCECLESILSQNFSDIEILLIDDESPDEAYCVVSKYLTKYSFIRYTRISHGGLSRARNIGIQQATGEFIAFLDSDDTLLPGYLSKLYEGIASADLCICGIQKFNVNRQDISNDMIGGSLSNDDALSYLLQKKYDFSSVCNKLYRTSVIQENHIRFLEGLFYEDILFNTKYLCAVQSCHAIKERLYCYQKREKSITTAPTIKNVIDYYVVANCVRNSIDPQVHEEALRVFLTNIAQKMLMLVPTIELGTSDDALGFLEKLSKNLLAMGGISNEMECGLGNGTLL